jgi:hypothetical protein
MRCSSGALAFRFGFRFQTGKGFLTVDRLHLAALQVIVSAIELLAHSRELVKVSGNNILNQFIRWPPGFGCQLVELGLQIVVKVHFHDFKIRESRRGGNREMVANLERPTDKSSRLLMIDPRDHVKRAVDCVDNKIRLLASDSVRCFGLDQVQAIR